MQALSEYMPRFIAVIDPFRGMFWLVLRMAAVVRVRVSAVIAMAMAASLESFWVFIVVLTIYIASSKY